MVTLFKCLLWVLQKLKFPCDGWHSLLEEPIENLHIVLISLSRCDSMFLFPTYVDKLFFGHFNYMLPIFRLTITLPSQANYEADANLCSSFIISMK